MEEKVTLCGLDGLDWLAIVLRVQVLCVVVVSGLFTSIQISKFYSYEFSLLLSVTFLTLCLSRSFVCVCPATHNLLHRSPNYKKRKVIHDKTRISI